MRAMRAIIDPEERGPKIKRLCDELDSEISIERPIIERPRVERLKIERKVDRQGTVNMRATDLDVTERKRS